MGYSIREAARQIGVGPIRLSQWERDIRKPGIENLVKLAVLYRVLVDELCFDVRRETVHAMDDRLSRSNGKEIKVNKEKPP